jgi:hypothetical protein
MSLSISNALVWEDGFLSGETVFIVWSVSVFAVSRHPRYMEGMMVAMGCTRERILPPDHRLAHGSVSGFIMYLFSSILLHGYS